MRIRFLGDANFDQDIVSGLWRRQPLVEFPDGTEDPEVLAIAARLGAVLATHDVRTMPFHFADFIRHYRPA